MKLYMDILFLVVIGYFIFKFIYLLIKMKQEVILPITDEDAFSIRKHPTKPVDFPTYSEQRIGIIFYAILLLIVSIMFLLGAFIDLFNWSLYFLIFLPIANSQSLLNLFAVGTDGLLSGNRFVPWRKVKSFHFVPIDLNHKYYGYSQEVNQGYELKIKTKGFPVNSVVTSDKMKEKISKILNEHISEGF